MYEFYTTISNFIMNMSTPNSLDIPIIELPILMEPLNEFLDQNARTRRELAARMVYYIHYKEFQHKLLQGDIVSKHNMHMFIFGVCPDKYDRVQP